MGGSKHTGSSPCASCKLLRRRCAKECIFAPYFPADEPHKFACVHKVFGASNVSKILQDLPVDLRADAVGSLVYEANARVRNPVYGCVGLISCLEKQIVDLRMQLAMANAEMGCLRRSTISSEDFDSKQVVALDHPLHQNNYQIAYPTCDPSDQFQVQAPVWACQ